MSFSSVLSFCQHLSISKQVRPMAAKPKKVKSTVTVIPLMEERRRVWRPLPLPQVIEGSGSEEDWETWLREVRLENERSSHEGDTSPMPLGPT